VVWNRKNSDLFIALVEELCRHYRRARRIHLLLDNFIIHKSKRTLRQPSQVPRCRCSAMRREDLRSSAGY